MYGFMWGVFVACNQEDASVDQASQSGWDTYEPTVPDEEMLYWLLESPVLWPSQECFPVDDETVLPEDTPMFETEDGLEVCFWNHVSGAVPEGQEFAEVGECNIVRTQGPSWFIPPVPLIEFEPELLEDEDYMTELNWVKEQGLSSGCGCCHSSKSSGYASKWDYDAPGIWTDTMPMSGIVMGAGLAEEHNLFGFWDESDNFGFNREHTLIPTTDIERMKAFFMIEFERRGGVEQDVLDAAEQFMTVNFQLFEEPSECIAPFEGIDEDGLLKWNGDEARQIYVQEVGAANPGFQPNFDLPEGTVWALYVEPDTDGIQSGELAFGEIPAGTKQFIPADGSKPVFEQGKTYRLFVTPDVMVLRHANCLFTMPEISSEE